MKVLKRMTFFVIMFLMVMTLYLVASTDTSHADDSINPPEITDMSIETRIESDEEPYNLLYAGRVRIQYECKTDLSPKTVTVGVHLYVNNEFIDDINPEEWDIYQDNRYDEGSGTEVPVLTAHIYTYVSPASKEDVTVKAVPYITVNNETITGTEKTITESYDSFHTTMSTRNWTQEYDPDSKTITISGNDISYPEMNCLAGIGSLAEQLVFSEGLVHIPEGWIHPDFSNVREISLPNSLEEIGGNSFNNAFKLTSVTIPPNVRYLGGFQNCTSLTEVVFQGNNIHYFESHTFAGCTSLTSFTIPETVREIYNDTFKGCTNLKKLVIPKTVFTLASSICDDCSEDLVIDTPTGSMGYMYANAYDIPVTHEFGDWEVKKEATDDEDGLKERVCSNCGEAEQEVIPKLKPDTGEVTEEEFNNVKTELEEVKGKLATAEGKLATVIQELDTAKTDLADARTRLEEAEGKLAAAETELATAKANLETAERKVAELTGKLSELESKQAQAELKQAESEKAIAALQLSVAELNQRLTKAETDAADAKVEAAESKVKELELEKTVAELQLKLAVATTKVTVSKLTPGKKVLTVKWTVKGDVKEGFEIQYALNKTFKSPKKITVKSSTARSRKIKSLKSGKKYFVRVRSYKEVEGKKYYTDWSKAKSAKVK